ncbi:co-chaperone GroES [Candidatus Berkelbacteria bacterium]|nr:co-chaperone GroES [Candidatus Berkelbacteria bacterium]
MANLKPIGDKILVRPIDSEEVTKSGIVLPDTAKEKPQEGEVLAVGAGKLDPDKSGKRIPLEVKKGDRVIFAKYGGDEIKVNGEELKIISESDVLAIVEK